MHYDLKKPCPHCPFRTDCFKGWLGEERAEEIVASITDQQQSFPCHETTAGDDDDGEPVRTDDEQHCAGALVFLERLEQPNQMMRISERLGLYDCRKLDMDSPVFESVEDFIDHHTR